MSPKQKPQDVTPRELVEAPDEEARKELEIWGYPSPAFGAQYRTLILLIVGILLVGIYGLYLLNRRSAGERLADYPNAQNLQSTEFTLTDSGRAYERTITFETSDSPETVLAYYARTLTSAGWSADYQGQPWPFPAYGDRSSREGLATYTVGIETSSGTEGKTQVTLHLWKIRAWWE